MSEKKHVISENIHVLDIQKLITEWKIVVSDILNDHWLSKIITSKWTILIKAETKELASPEWVFYDSINSNTDTPWLISKQRDWKFVLLSAFSGELLLPEWVFYEEMYYEDCYIFCQDSSWIKLLDDYWEEIFTYKTSEAVRICNESSNFLKTWLFHIVKWDSRLISRKWNIIDSCERKVVENWKNTIELWMHYFDENKKQFYRFQEVKKYFGILKRIEKYYIPNQEPIGRENTFYR